MKSTTIMGVDGGGTSTTVRVVADGVILFEAQSGPGNVASSPKWRAHLLDAMAGAPLPDVVVGAFAGIGVSGNRCTVARLLRTTFSSAEIRVAPDHVAAAFASPAADAVVLAGTGSVVVSCVDDTVRFTGGHGHQAGDHGSGYRLGRRLLEELLNQPVMAWPNDVTPAIATALGTADPARLSSILNTPQVPVAAIASLAPLLDELAVQDVIWASESLADELGRLAETLMQHLGAHHRNVFNPVVELAGGVWKSQRIVDEFVRLLGNSGLDVGVCVAAEPPVHGAIRLGLLDRDAYARILPDYLVVTS